MRHSLAGLSSVVVSLAVAALSEGAHTQCVLAEFSEQVHASAGNLGWDLAVDSDLAVATAVEDFAPGAHHVWIWRRIDGVWVEETALVPVQAPQTPGNGATDRVALDDGVLAVGRNNSVHVYRDNGGQWDLEAILMLQVPGPFGRSLALQGDVLVVGRPSSAPATGAAYVFRHGPSGWAFEDELLVPAPQLFGISVAIDGDDIAVGDSHDGASGPLHGAVHLFHRQGAAWELATTLPAGPDDHEFGRHVALSGEQLLIEGSHDVNGAYPPVLTFYHRIGGAWQLWDVEPLPVEPQGTQAADIDLEGDLAIAGLPVVDGGAPASGAALIYRMGPGGWDAVGTLTAPQPLPQERFGQAVALDGQRVFASAPLADGIWPDEGRLYEAGGTPGDTWWSAVGPALAGGDGEPCLFLEGSGQSLSSATLVLGKALPGAPAALVVGSSVALLPLKGGTLVPAPEIVVPGFVVGAGGQLELDFSWPDVPPGFTLVVQAWVADAQAVAGFAASNGVQSPP